VAVGFSEPENAPNSLPGLWQTLTKTAKFVVHIMTSCRRVQGKTTQCGPSLLRMKFCSRNVNIFCTNRYLGRWELDLSLIVSIYPLNLRDCTSPNSSRISNLAIGLSCRNFNKHNCCPHYFNTKAGIRITQSPFLAPMAERNFQMGPFTTHGCRRGLRLLQMTGEVLRATVQELQEWCVTY
jgi:hypothetical protein